MNTTYATMQLVNKYDIAGVSLNNGILTVNDTAYSLSNKHYNVEVYRTNEGYVVEAEEARCIFRFDTVRDEKELERLVPKHIKYTTPKLFGIIKGGVPYADPGYLELKERKKVRYRANSINIIENC